jgi:hypothetical protein
MRTVRLIALAAIAATVAGCAVTGPMIPALPGSQKSAEAFQSDDRACRDEATGIVSSMSSVYGQGAYYSLQRFYDAKYLQCMYAHGNRVPADFAQEAYVQQPYGAPPYGVPPYPPRDYPPPAGAPSSGAPASSAMPK